MKTWEITLASGRQVQLSIDENKTSPQIAIEMGVVLRGRNTYLGEQLEELVINPNHIESFRRVS